jgi:adenylate kinase
MAKIEEEEGEGLAAEIKAKLDELRDAAVAKIEEERAEKDYGDEEPPEIDREGLPIRVPDSIIYQLMILRLNENDCRNRGYVLDGYPRSFEDCQHIFLKKEKKFDEEGNEVEEDEPELEEGQKKSFKGYIIEPSIVPSSTIVFNQEDKFLLSRVMNLSESEIAGTHYNVEDMKRRLKSYRDINES